MCLCVHATGHVMGRGEPSGVSFLLLTWVPGMRWDSGHQAWLAGKKLLPELASPCNVINNKLLQQQ